MALPQHQKLINAYFNKIILLSLKSCQKTLFRSCRRFSRNRRTLTEDLISQFFKFLLSLICQNCFQKQPPEVFCKKGVLRNFTKFRGKHLCQDLFFKVAGMRSVTLLKKRLWHRCLPVNFAKFLRTPFLQNISRPMFLYFHRHLHVHRCHCHYYVNLLQPTNSHQTPTFFKYHLF